MLRWFKRATARDRRTFTRDPVRAEATLAMGEVRLACHIADVSPGGAFLTPDPGLPIGTEALLTLAQLSLETPVRVVRRTEEGVGIEFVAANVGAIVAGWTRGRSPA